MDFGFWISVDYPKVLFEISEFLFKDNINSLIPLIFGLLFIMYIIFKLIKYEDKNNFIYKISIISLGVVIFVIAASLIISGYRAIFIPRYMLPMLGLILFAIACIISFEKNKYIIISIFTGIICLNIWNYSILLNKCYSNENRIIKNLENVQSDDIFVYEDINVGGVISIYYAKNSQYFYNKNNWGIHEAYKAFEPQMKIIEDIQNIQSINKIWVIDSNYTNLYEEIKNKENMKELITKKEVYNPYSDSLFVVSLFEKNSI